jgi:hypothetical protein
MCFEIEVLHIQANGTSNERLMKEEKCGSSGGCLTFEKTWNFLILS